LVGWTIFSILLGMIGAMHTGHPVWQTVLMAVVFATAALTVVRWMMNRALPWILAYTSWPGGVLSLSISLALLSAALMEWVGVHAIFGAFLAGVVIGDSHHMREQTRSNIDQFVSNIFAPIFFASLGLKVNFITRFDPLVVGVVVAIACLGKVLGCRIGAWFARVPNRQAWALGFGMNSRGAVEIVLASLALQADLIRPRLFVALVVMALVTSMLSGPLMKLMLRRPAARRLEGFVAPRTFRGALAARTAEEAIDQLAVPAAEAAGMPARVVKEAVWARERLMSTALGHGVAVPHARLEGLARPVVTVGLAAEGVNWHAADGQPTRLVVLLLTPERDEGAQLELISDVARTFRDPAMLDAALKTQSYTEFLALLRTGVPS
ncbi:MAG TPA: cation:proton antiporter, partial [bacterium]